MKLLHFNKGGDNHISNYQPVLKTATSPQKGVKL